MYGGAITTRVRPPERRYSPAISQPSASECLWLCPGQTAVSGRHGARGASLPTTTGSLAQSIDSSVHWGQIKPAWPGASRFLSQRRRAGSSESSNPYLHACLLSCFVWCEYAARRMRLHDQILHEPTRPANPYE